MTGTYLALSTGYRERCADDTLEAVRGFADALGVRRVFDITRLDKIGLPVFAAVRPDAATLCVTAGKGLTLQEARVSALMESVELAIAERHQPEGGLAFFSAAQYREASGLSILSFCPVLGSSLPSDLAIACCWAEDVAASVLCPIPAEAVLFDSGVRPLRQPFLGSTSVGLASGNSVLEASLHGLCEVLERDVQSFAALADDSELVDPGTLPAALRDILALVNDAGLECWIRHQGNAYGVPCFTCLLMDPEAGEPMFANGGFGCHPDAGTAASKAVLEAVQSRLSIIHGGRDDLEEMASLFAPMSPAQRQSYVDALRLRGASAGRVRQFSTIASLPSRNSLEATWSDLVERVAAGGHQRILRYVYTLPSDPVQVVRIAVPGAENFTRLTAKVGPRLLAHFRALS